MIYPYVSRNTELTQTMIYLAAGSPTQKLGNKEYCKEIDRYFAQYREHASIGLTHKLMAESYFTYDRPHKAALSLDRLCNDESAEYHHWAIAAKQFAEESSFDKFFMAHADYYQGIVDRVKGCQLDGWIEYVNRLFGYCNDNLHIVICLLDGNYGFSLYEEGVRKNYVIRCLPLFDQNGNEKWLAGRLANGIVHEYAHTYVNPVVESHADILKNHADFFRAHTNMPSCYNADYAIINEYFVRACTILFLQEYNFEDLDSSDEIERHRKSFPYIKRFIEALKNFNCIKENFESFYLRMIDELL